MKKVSLITVVLFISTIAFNQTVTNPKDFFGFKPGTDRMLFTYEKLIDYLFEVDKQSDRLQLVEIGKSPMNRPMYVAFISSEDNISKLNSLKEINRKLALDYNLPIADLKSIVKEGKVFVLGSLSMHASEVGPSQAAPLIVYDYLTTKDEAKLNVLNNVVYMMVPSHNPDGMDMIVDHYNKYKGTKYEGTSFPGVYHKYVGHDNNRDFVTITQLDNKVISELSSSSWFPQVMVEKHQMGSTGPRYFVPPYHDPIAENIDAELWTWGGLFGQNMVNDMTAKGLKGVAQHTIFDDYWPGSAETCNWKNVISLLTEAASVQLAKPIYVEPTELNVWGKGLSEYKKSTNFTDPWPGGWWRLSDIVDYEIASTESILNTASLYKERILAFMNNMCKSEYMRGQSQPPYYFVVPEDQSDKSELVNLVHLLKEHGVKVCKLKADYTFGTTCYKKGDIVVPLAQPFRAFVKEVMETQKFPKRHYTPDGEMIQPYDITSWSLPLHKGLVSHQLDVRNLDFENNIIEVDNSYSLGTNNDNNYKYAILTSTNNQAFKLTFEALNLGLKVDRNLIDIEVDGSKIPAGSFIIKKQDKLDNILKSAVFPIIYSDAVTTDKLSPVALPRIAIVETYNQDIDAGWTRYIFDNYSIKFTSLRPHEFETLDLISKFDIIVFPDQDPSIIKDGKVKRENNYYSGNYPPEFTKGMGTKGFDNLMNFLNNGGIAISWGQSTGLFEGNLSIKDKATTEEFRLPFRNTIDQLTKKGLNCPGTLLRLKLSIDSPITYGMGSYAGIFFESAAAFSTSIPTFDMDRKVIGYFEEDDQLLSGLLENGNLLYNKSEVVWMKKGKGQFVIFGFTPIFRASVPGNYKLVFNSLLLDRIKE